MPRAVVALILIGVAGGLGFAAATLVPTLPLAVLGASAVLCVVALYGAIIYRVRLRGQSVLDALRISYEANLSKFERVAFVSTGLVIVVLSALEWGGLPSLFSIGLGAMSVYWGVVGKPPGSASIRPTVPPSTKPSGLLEATAVDREFERLLHEFLHDHPEVSHEWREIGGSSPRRDVICGADTRGEVFASLNRGGQIAVGITRSGDHTDFEDFGRNLGDDAIAREAFTYFVECLREGGQLPR